MSDVRTSCDAGCGGWFTVELMTIYCDDDIYKTCFYCPLCGHEYIAFYADDDVRELQRKMRDAQQQFADPWANHVAASKIEAELKAAIKEKMDELRRRMEGRAGHDGLLQEQTLEAQASGDPTKG